jgi:uncharacterized protein (DUF1697 family)
MKSYIALLRGINVGGRHVLPMKELRELLENQGLQNVRTYIQSGNVVFQSVENDTSRLAADISAAILEEYGFEPAVLILASEEMEEAMVANPFPEAQSEPKFLHLFFMASLPRSPDLQALQGLKKGEERFALRGAVFYLHAPDGIGRSKLAANIEKALGVPVTARNWLSVSKIMAIARE